jgi:serine protease
MSGVNTRTVEKTYRPRVVVKFTDDVRVPGEGDIAEYLHEAEVGPVERLTEAFPGIEFDRLFVSLDPEQLDGLVKQATERDRTYRPPNFRTFFAVTCPPGVDPDEVQARVAEWRSVEYSYVEGGPTPPPAVSAADDPRWPDQGYLDPAPDGIDAEYAWTVAGGDGQGVGFVDLERGWTFDHEDLTGASVSLISGVSKDFHGHGTAVLGEVSAVDNSLGCVGTTPALGSVRAVSQWRTNSTYDTADAIVSAVAVMDFGDVLLLEAQTSQMGYGYLPVEVENATYEAIRLGTALGIVIVEAAGNGSEDLDAYTTPLGDAILNRGSADFRDSGAILVGAGSATAPHGRLGFSNYGSRIDCYGWGESINTTGDGWTGTGTTTYTASFGGTSGASPIVSGAALSVQGMAEQSLGYRFSPRQLRSMLADPANGTQSASPASDGIGVMPDLRTIATTVLNTTPDVYIRDFVGDTGDPHSGSISASPDVVLRPAQVTDPQAEFGEGSAGENSATLGFEAVAGQDNYVYVRLQNRGGASAQNVTATVYWSPVATLVTPDLWTEVGTTTAAATPTPSEVAAGEMLTVMEPITWDAGEIPGAGHYCFVALIGSDGDPAPDPADFTDWNTFRTYIRDNNNVTWRNFNVVSSVPPAGGRYVALPFLAPGAPDAARPMQLEVQARLPDGARAFLELPQYVVEKLDESPNHREALAEIEPPEGEAVAYIPVNPHGRRLLDAIPFPARSRTEMRLLVHVPEAAREHTYRVAVRQLFENEEVGRVTWQLTPPEEIGGGKEAREPARLPVIYVEGIGMVGEARLRSGGIETVGDLSTADPDAVADCLDVSTDRAAGFVEMARLMTFGADRQTAELLVSAGVEAADVADLTPDEIHETLAKAAAARLAPVPVGYDHESVDADALVAAAKRD